MFLYAVVVFALAAVGGVALALIRARTGENPPMAVALAHGVLAATGLGLLVVGNVQTGFGGLPTASLGLFGVAAIGGFVLFATHLGGKTIRLALVGVHGAAAVLAFLLLLVAVVSG